MGFCACDKTIINTGTPTKQRVVASGVKLIGVRMKADDGTNNQILSTDVIDQAYLDAKINHEDESKRWYPIGDFVNETDERADTVTETYNNGSSSLIQQGVRAYNGDLLNFSTAYIGVLESFRCFGFGVYTVDTCGAPTGSISKDGTALRPIRVNENSWDPQYIKATPTTAGKVMLKFEFSQLEKDKYLRTVSENEVTADFLAAEGLLPLKGTNTAISTTGFTSAIKVDFDIFQDASKEVVPAWVLGDFNLFNTTTNTSVTIDSVTESPEGTYTFAFAAQTVGDVLKLTNVKTSAQKAGFFLEETITLA